jgi:hypothetical protein
MLAKNSDVLCRRPTVDGTSLALAWEIEYGPCWKYGTGTSSSSRLGVSARAEPASGGHRTGGT